MTEPSDAVPAEFLDEPGRYFLEWIPRLVRDNAGASGHFGRRSAVAQFHLTGDGGGWWHVVLGAGEVQAHEGRHLCPSFTLSMSVDVWRDVNRGEVSGLGAYLRGQIRLSGSRFTFVRVARLFG